MSTTTHNPSQFDPSAYALVGGIYFGDDAEEANAVTDRAASAALRERPWGGHEDGKCAHCGTRFLYGAVFTHLPTGEAVVAGHQCADKHFDPATDRAAFAILRLHRRVEAARENAKRITRREAFLAGHPGLDEALTADHYISGDLSRKLDQYGSLSPRQVELAFKLAADVAEKAARVAADKAALADVEPLAEGRYTVEGEIVHTKWVENDFGGALKCIVRLADGNKIWGSVPRAIDDAEKGDRVRFVAKVTRSDDDDHFGFYSRPTKAEFIGAEVAA